MNSWKLFNIALSPEMRNLQDDGKGVKIQLQNSNWTRRQTKGKKKV